MTPCGPCALAAEALNLERTLSNLVCQLFPLTPAEIGPAWKNGFLLNVQGCRPISFAGSQEAVPIQRGTARNICSVLALGGFLLVN